MKPAWKSGQSGAIKRFGPHKMASKGPAKRSGGKMRGRRGVRK